MERAIFLSNVDIRPQFTKTVGAKAVEEKKEHKQDNQSKSGNSSKENQSGKQQTDKNLGVK